MLLTPHRKEFLIHAGAFLMVGFVAYLFWKHLQTVNALDVGAGEGGATVDPILAGTTPWGLSGYQPGGTGTHNFLTDPFGGGAPAMSLGQAEASLPAGATIEPLGQATYDYMPPTAGTGTVAAVPTIYQAPVQPGGGGGGSATAPVPTGGNVTVTTRAGAPTPPMGGGAAHPPAPIPVSPVPTVTVPPFTIPTYDPPTIDTPTFTPNVVPTPPTPVPTVTTKEGTDVPGNPEHNFGNADPSSAPVTPPDNSNLFGDLWDYLNNINNTNPGTPTIYGGAVIPTAPFLDPNVSTKEGADVPGNPLQNFGNTSPIGDGHTPPQTSPPGSEGDDLAPVEVTGQQWGGGNDGGYDAGNYGDYTTNYGNGQIDNSSYFNQTVQAVPIDQNAVVWPVWDSTYGMNFDPTYGPDFWG